jgi:putative membrane protein
MVKVIIFDFIKGIFLGLALVIPGLSASAFAVVLGFYQKLIFSLNSLRKEPKQSLKFLLPIALGAIAGVLASAGLLLTIIYRFPIPGYAYFIGLVLGSIPAIYQKIRPGLSKKLNYVFLILGLGLIISLGMLTPETETGPQLQHIGNIGHVLLIAAAGFVSCFLIAFPGVSGAMVLVLMGLYTTILGAVSNFADAVVGAFRGYEGVWHTGLNALLIAAIFLAGSLIGLFTASGLIGKLLRRYETSVYFAVMGLIVGGVYVLYEIGIEGNLVGFTTGSSFIIVRELALIAAFVVLGYFCTGFIRSKEQ